ncbi:hypothetical protein POM88_052631 [Heracleum sosnowskyi]|uniref:Retrotransposon gag domain-containing protein n=1 Tax=Heracleum sosnowskyi TaxID=360622 RepID=A0AAD8GQQ1_9APIA|nr:hypothetical protein POM88_052631 [Heracleum sosnowskyi]
MSQNRNERPRDEILSEDSEESNHARHEEYVPHSVPNPSYGTPIVGGRPPVLISNSDLMEQLYRMGDALNGFEARLDTVERSEGRGRVRRQPHNHHRTGRGTTGQRRFQNVTPRRLEYQEDGVPIVELPDDETDNQDRPRRERRPSPHPHRSGRSESEVRRADELHRDEEQRLNRLKDRLGIRLNNDDLRLLLVEWQRDREVRGEQPLDPQREPPVDRSRPHGQDHTQHRNNSRRNLEVQPHNPQREPPVNRLRPHGHEQAPSRDDPRNDRDVRTRDSQRVPPDLRLRPRDHERAPQSEGSGRRMDMELDYRSRDNDRRNRYEAPYRGGPSGGRGPHITSVSSQSRSGGRQEEPRTRLHSQEERTRPNSHEGRTRPPSPNPRTQETPAAQGETQPPQSPPQPPPTDNAQTNVQTIPGVGSFNVDDLKKLLTHLEGGRVTSTTQTPSPFSTAVREAQLPTGYRNTTNDLRFHGNADPVEFLGRFNIEMDVYQVPDLARCRLLAATFRESAQQWFQKLGPGVITSWEVMKTLFLTKFQATVKYAPPVTTLANIRQKEGESLQSYFKRFNAESTMVRGATDESLKSFLIAGLQVGTDFWKHLQGKDPATLADLFAQAEYFKIVEQSLVDNKKSDSQGKGKGSKRKDRSPSPDYRRRGYSPNRVNVANARRGWTPPDYDRLNRYQTGSYTLAASVEHIFEVNKDKGLFKKPAPLSSWQSKDKKRYCSYHESTGHNTHECRQIKEEIEELIKAGYLTDWIVREVKKHKDETDRRMEREHAPERDDDRSKDVPFTRAGSIHTIFGGRHFGGDSNNALERYAREARHKPLTNVNSLELKPPKLFRGESVDITFTEEEARWTMEVR